MLVKDKAVVAVGGELQHIGGAPEAGVAPPQLPGDGGDGVVDGGGLFQLPVAGQVPLADVGGLIARLLDVAAQGLHPGGQHDVVPEAARLGGPLARLEQGPAGAAHRLGGEGVVKLHPLPGQGVQIGRDIQGLAEAAAGIPALLVGEIKNNVVGHGHASFCAFRSFILPRTMVPTASRIRTRKMMQYTLLKKILGFPLEISRARRKFVSVMLPSTSPRRMGTGGSSSFRRIQASIPKIRAMPTSK